jgi:hypothetical protein
VEHVEGGSDVVDGGHGGDDRRGEWISTNR